MTESRFRRRRFDRGGGRRTRRGRRRFHRGGPDAEGEKALATAEGRTRRGRRRLQPGRAGRGEGRRRLQPRRAGRGGGEDACNRGGPDAEGGRRRLPPRRAGRGGRDDACDRGGPDTEGEMTLATAERRRRTRRPRSFLARPSPRHRRPSAVRASSPPPPWFLSPRLKPRDHLCSDLFRVSSAFAV